MAARNEIIVIAPYTWVRVTLDPVASLMLQNQIRYTIKVAKTTGTSAPSGSFATIDLSPERAITADLLLSDLFPGLASSAGHVWVYSIVGGAVSVSHA